MALKPLRVWASHLSVKWHWPGTVKVVEIGTPLPTESASPVPQVVEELADTSEVFSQDRVQQRFGQTAASSSFMRKASVDEAMKEDHSGQRLE